MPGDKEIRDNLKKLAKNLEAYLKMAKGIYEQAKRSNPPDGGNFGKYLSKLGNIEALIENQAYFQACLTSYSPETLSALITLSDYVNEFKDGVSQYPDRGSQKANKHLLLQGANKVPALDALLQQVHACKADIEPPSDQLSSGMQHN